MSNYNPQKQVVYADMLQTPVIEHNFIEFRSEPKKAHEYQPNLLTTEHKPLKLNLANGCLIRKRRDMKHLNDSSTICNVSNRASQIDVNTATYPQQIISLTPYLKSVKSPFDDLQIAPIDLRSPILNEGTSSNGTISDFSTILDMTLNHNDTSANGHQYDEPNLDIKIANSFLGQHENPPTQTHQLNPVSNYASETTEFLEPKYEVRTLDNELSITYPDSTESDVKNVIGYPNVCKNEPPADGNPPTSRKVRVTTRRGKVNKNQDSYQCSQCKRVYKWKFNLNRHLKFECNKENAFECTQCGQKFPYKQNCTQHISRTHHIKLESSEQYLMQGHIKIHATLDTFGKATAKPLMKTETTHEFECGICGHRLSYQLSIIEHLNRDHNVYSTNGWIKFVKK